MMIAKMIIDPENVDQYQTMVKNMELLGKLNLNEMEDDGNLDLTIKLKEVYEQCQSQLLPLLAANVPGQADV